MVRICREALRLACPRPEDEFAWREAADAARPALEGHEGETFVRRA
jgi:hypothetical protein